MIFTVYMERLSINRRWCPVFFKFWKAYDTPWKYRFQKISLLWGGKENYPISITNISTRNLNVKVNSTFLNLFEQEEDFQHPFKKQELLPILEHMSSPPFFGGVRVLIFLVLCVVLVCVFTFCVACCDVRSDFHIKTMFGSFFISSCL